MLFSCPFYLTDKNFGSFGSPSLQDQDLLTLLFTLRQSFLLVKLTIFLVFNLQTMTCPNDAITCIPGNFLKHVTKLLLQEVFPNRYWYSNHPQNISSWALSILLTLTLNSLWPQLFLPTCYSYSWQDMSASSFLEWPSSLWHK